MAKTNKKFMILSFLGIILVVLGHTGQAVNGLFPIYSFHMVLFMFISGYFYKPENESNVIKYTIKKIKKLLIPFFIWNLIYGIIGMILRNFGIINYGKDINLTTLFIEPWQLGNQYMLNVASWFIPALFLINIVYLIIRLFLSKFKIWNETVMLVLFAMLSIACGYMCKQDFNNYLIPLFRTGFCLFFYHFGYYYKLYIENKLKLRTEIYLLILILIELLILKIGGYLNYHLYSMNFVNKNIICIFIAGINGILFWIKIAEIIEPILKDNKLVNYIGNNTFDIVVHHMFWVLLINLVLFGLTNINNINGFDISKFKRTIYYFYTSGIAQSKIIYCFIGIGGPMLMRYIIDKLKELLKNKFN